MNEAAPGTTEADEKRGVAQLVGRVLWEHETAGSSPVTPSFWCCDIMSR